MHSFSQRIRVESPTPPWLPVPAFSGGLGSQRAEELRCRLGSPGADPGSPVLHLPQIGVRQPRGQKVVGSVISRQRLLQTLHVRSLGSSSAPLPTPGERAPHRLPEPMKLARLGRPAAWLARSLPGPQLGWLAAWQGRGKRGYGLLHRHRLGWRGQSGAPASALGALHRCPGPLGSAHNLPSSCPGSSGLCPGSACLEMHVDSNLQKGAPEGQSTPVPVKIRVDSWASL